MKYSEKIPVFINITLFNTHCDCKCFEYYTTTADLGGSVGGHGFNPCRGWQHSFVEIDHEIFSTVILSLPLIQEGQLSVSGKRMCTILVHCLEDYACPVNV